MDHLKKNRAYFGEPLDLVDQFGIEGILTFHLDFDPEIMLSSLLLSTSTRMRSGP